MSNVQYFKSIIDQDLCPVVICDLEHTIVYMNPASIKAYGDIVGSSLLKCHNEKSNELIIKTVEWFKQSPLNNRIHTFYNQSKNKDVYMVALRDDSKQLIGYYEKHEYRAKDVAPFYNFEN